MHILFDEVHSKEIAKFDNFYDAIELAETIKHVIVFRLEFRDKALIGLRISPEEVVWRRPRKEEKRRGRDRWFYHWKDRILGYLK